MEASSLSTLVSNYALRLNAHVTDHQVSSPLGAWLLLALASREDGPNRGKVEEVLGTSIPDAKRHAHDLLGRQHPAVKAALGLWIDPTEETPALHAWEENLPKGTRGPIPTLEEADAWVKDNTLGLIDKMPPFPGDTTLLLANTLATKVSWDVPLDIVEEPLGDWDASSHLRDTQKGNVLIVESSIGLLAVHQAKSTDGLLVLSVQGPPDAEASSVLAAAHQVAQDGSFTWGRFDTKDSIPLHDLPLEDGHSWTITEKESINDQYTCDLPAWTASSTHDLNSKDLGLQTAGRDLALLLKSGGDDVNAEQVATASYTSKGFEAAAVTRLYITRGARPTATTRRHLHAQFTRAHAVVAVTTDSTDTSSPWHLLPVFSAWIAQAQEATTP